MLINLRVRIEEYKELKKKLDYEQGDLEYCKKYQGGYY